MSGVRSLLAHCGSLEAVGDLECFNKISGPEIAALREWVAENNLKLAVDGDGGGSKRGSEYGIYLENAIM